MTREAIATVATGSATRARVALTHRGVEALRPEAIAYRMPDLRCPGLALRVAPNGLKTWDVAFRIRGAGLVRRLSLGPFPAISLDVARERTNALTKAAKAGRDLVAEEATIRRALEQRTTVGELIEQYLQRKVRGKLRTAHEIELRLKRVLSPLKSRFADEIRRRDLRVILDATADRGALREASKQRELVRSLFRWAISQDIVENDPATGLASYGANQRRDRILSPEEIKILWNWLETSGMPSAYSEALKLQLAIGARIGEVGGMAVAELDQENWLWTLPALRSKNGRARVTPLVGIARTIVAQRLEMVKKGPLFTKQDGSALTSNCVSSLIVKRRTDIPIEHFTSHDLRRTVATGLVDLGCSFEVTALVLGHEAGGQNVRVLLRHYVRSELVERKRVALEAWDNHLRQTLSGDTPAANIISIKSNREQAVA